MTFPIKAGSGNIDFGLAISSLNDGNSITTGYFNGENVDFGSISLDSEGMKDIFITKIDGNGNYIWAKNFGSTATDTGYGVGTLSDGSSIVTGNFIGSVGFDSINLNSGSSRKDVFISKLDNNGNVIWAKRGGSTTHDDTGYAISTLNNGSCIITGEFQGSADFDGVSLTSSAGNKDIFVAKLDNSGTVVWVKKLGSTTKDDTGRGITTLSDGSSIVIGEFQGTANFGGTNLNSEGNKDVFITKLDSNGNVVWANQIGGNNEDIGWGISSFSDGSSIITGSFKSKVEFEIGSGDELTAVDLKDIFIAKLDSNGNFVWMKKAGGSSNDGGYAVSTLSDGSSIITGSFSGSATFGSTPLNGSGHTDIFVTKLDSNGNFLWATKAGGALNQAGRGVSTLSDGRAITTGYFNSTTVFGSSSLTSAGSADIFTAAIDTNGDWISALDLTPPKIAITDDDDDNSLSFGDTSTITFTLSEASSNFIQSDVSVSGGSLSNWTAVSSTVYTATFTPTADSTTNGVIHVANDKFSDAASNNNQDETEANNTVTLTVDTSRPVIAITEDDADNTLSAGDTSTITFTLSEAATDFVEGDATVSGGSLSNWTAVSSTVYTATFTPTANSTTDGVIHVANDKFSDAAGNNNKDETDANNTVSFTVDSTITPTPSPSPTPSPEPSSTPSPEPSPEPSSTPSPDPSPTPVTSSGKGDVYLLLDTSTSMLHSEAKDHSKFQCLIALEVFAQDAERAGYQFQRRDNNTTVTSTQLLQILASQTSTQAIQELDNYTFIDNPNDAKNADNLDIHLITYNYHVQHNAFTLSATNPDSGIDAMQAILSLKMAGERFGNSIRSNTNWKALGLPDPNSNDLYQGSPDRPSNLYAGTELLGALEGLNYLLTNKANDPNRHNHSTTISLVLDGRPERRSWWDTRTDSASYSITGQAIPLPDSLGKEDITTSGLLYDTEGKEHFFKNNQGQWQWKDMQNELNAALDLLADYSADPTTIQVNAFGLHNTGKPSLATTYQDLFSNQTFDNSSGGWGYSHQIIQSLQDLNL